MIVFVRRATCSCSVVRGGFRLPAPRERGRAEVLLRGALFLVIALLSGCPTAFERDTGPDAAPFDGGTDAPCLDRDGDGARDAACGGTDCDDDDPLLGPGSPRCEGPITVVTCEDGVRVTAGCEAGVCDARTGFCEPEACGDGVLHAGEQCDDGNEVDGDLCAADCRFPLCVSDADCPTEAPSCSDYVSEDEGFRCRPLQAGLAISERCTSDSDCASGFCDPEQLRCSHGCMEDAECGVGEVWCLWPEQGTDPTAAIPGPHRCAYGCAVDAECPTGTFCTMPEMGPTRPAFTYCRYPNPAGGDFGSEHELAAAGACANWVYTLNSGLPVMGICTRACSADADCAPPMPYCRYLHDGLSGIPRPPPWRHPHNLACGESPLLPGP